MKNWKNKVGTISPICCKCRAKATVVLPQMPRYIHDKKGRMTGGIYGFDSYCEKHQFGKAMPIALVLNMNLGAN